MWREKEIKIYSQQEGGADMAAAGAVLTASMKNSGIKKKEFDFWFSYLFSGSILLRI